MWSDTTVAVMCGSEDEFCRNFTSCDACVTGGCFWVPSGSSCVTNEDEPWARLNCSYDGELISTVVNDVETSSSLPAVFATETEQSVSSIVSSSFVTEHYDVLISTMSPSSFVTETEGYYDEITSPMAPTFQSTAPPVHVCSTFTPHLIFALAVLTAVIFLCLAILITMCKLKKRSDFEFLLRHKPNEDGFELSGMPVRSTRGSTCRNGGIKPLYYHSHNV